MPFDNALGCFVDHSPEKTADIDGVRWTTRLRIEWMPENWSTSAFTRVRGELWFHELDSSDPPVEDPNKNDSITNCTDWYKLMAKAPPFSGGSWWKTEVTDSAGGAADGDGVIPTEASERWKFKNANGNFLPVWMRIKILQTIGAKKIKWVPGVAIQRQIPAGGEFQDVSDPSTIEETWVENNKP